MTAARPSAVVFAYHDVGVRCLKVLLSGGVEVRQVVTPLDDPAERQWYASVARTARDYGLPLEERDAVDPALAARIVSLAPDFIFSFYFRSLLPEPVLAAARRGALNMHGSLLPRYRGRAPVNWAILRGERTSGATLHYMVARADAGDLVDAQEVPILEDDDAREVFAKVTVAAEMVLARQLPALIAGTAPRRPQPILPGEYYGRRRPEDGRIDWRAPGRAIHDLVRAVAPPFPGAFAQVGAERWEIHRTRLVAAPRARSTAAAPPPSLTGRDGVCRVACVDGAELQILAAAIGGQPLDLDARARELEGRPVSLA